MTSWVVTISKEFPQHWDYARQYGVWDMPKRFGIQEGDLVYFRIAGGGLLGQTVATSSARALRAADTVPWDDGRDPYTTRFTFRLLSHRPLRVESWGATESRLMKRPVMQVPRSWSHPDDEAVLASYFEQEAPLLGQMHDLLRDAGIDVQDDDVESLIRDDREFAKRMVALREGQARFRESLLRVYPRCAVTGTDVTTVLEAAHIWPYSGTNSNVVTNGIILRRDIHRLFDLFALTVTTDLTVRVSPHLWGTDYAALDGRRLQVVPSDPAARPSPELLARHHAKCDWLRS